MFSKWACVFREYAKDGGFKKMKIGGLFSKNGPQKGTFLSQPLDSEWAAEIRWEGEREKQSPELGEMRRRRHCRRPGARRSGPNRRYGARFSKPRAPG
jgi:hypothetical protein